MQPLSGNQRPDLLTSLMNMSFVLRLPRTMHLCRSSSNVPRLPSFLEMVQIPHVLLTCEEVHNPLRLPRETTSEPPKVVRTPSVLYIFTSKCASHHNGVHFFDIATSKSAPSMVCFAHFDFEIRRPRPTQGGERQGREVVNKNNMFGRSKHFALDTISEHTLGTFSG